MVVRAREEGKTGEGDSKYCLEKFTEKVTFKLRDGESGATK